MSRIVPTLLVTMTLLLCGGWLAHADDVVAPVPCWFDIPKGEAAVCYRIAVPEHHDRDSDGDMSLPVAVLKSQALDVAEDPVVLVQGGPGASFFHTAYPDEPSIRFLWSMTAPVRQTRDVIVYDQRGVGLAKPNLNCAEADNVAASAKAPPGLETAFFDRDREEIRRCRERLEAAGIDLSAFSTPANADDLAFLIGALGYESADLWAMSYGTRVALETLRRHGALIGAAVLDGVYPPHIRSEELAPWATHRAFTRIFDDCARDTWCRQRYGDIGERFAELLASLNETPRMFAVDDLRWPGEPDVMLDGDLLVFHMYDALYYGSAIPYVPARVADALDNDLATLGWFYWYPFFADWSLDEGVFLSITCREETSRIRPDVLSQAVEQYGVYGSAGATILTGDICDDWPVPSSSEAEGQPVTSDVPVLLISGAYDPVTPPDWGADTASYLTNSRHFEFLGAGHVPSSADQCAARYVAAFFDNPDPASLVPPDCPLFLYPADFSSVDR